jgi:type IV pilus assembly protein PilM
MRPWFGLDIGSREIKVVQAEKSGPGFKISRAAAVANIKTDTATAVKQAMKEAGIRNSGEANVALSESAVTTRIIDVPRLSDTELASAVQYEAEQYIPYPLAETELFHQILAVDQNNDERPMKVLLIAVPKIRIQELTEILDKAEIIPKSLETELFSQKRLLTDPKKVQIIASFGGQSTDLMVLRYGICYLTYSIAIGSDALTKNLAAELSLSIEHAEEYKKTYGLRSDILEGKVAGILSPAMENIVSEINKALLNLGQQGYGAKQPDELVLTGGGALLPGLATFLATKLNLEAVVADPFSRFVRDNNFKKIFPNISNPQWTTVVSLALKGAI